MVESLVGVQKKVKLGTYSNIDFDAAQKLVIGLGLVDRPSNLQEATALDAGKIESLIPREIIGELDHLAGIKDTAGTDGPMNTAKQHLADVLRAKNQSLTPAQAETLVTNQLIGFLRQCRGSLRDESLGNYNSKRNGR